MFLYPLEGRCGFPSSSDTPNSTWINKKECYLRGKPWPVLTGLTPIVFLSQDSQQHQAQAWEVMWPDPLAENRLKQQVVGLWRSDPLACPFPDRPAKPGPGIRSQGVAPKDNL